MGEVHVRGEEVHIGGWEVYVKGERFVLEGGGGLCWGRVGFILEEGKVLGSCWRGEVLI